MTEEEASLIDLVGLDRRFSWLDIDIPLPLKSSCIAAATYNISKSHLRVAFVAGGEAMHEIGIITVIRLLKAESAGRFYNLEIRRH